MKLAIFDIEGDDLYEGITKIHCAWLWDSSSGIYYGYPPNRIHYLLSDLNYYDVICGHNIIGYDCPAIEKIQQGELTSVLYDTMVGSRLLDPDKLGGHSLKQLGKETGVLKTEYGEVDDDQVDVWKEFNWDMYWYCRDDVAATVSVYQRLLKRGLKPEDIIGDPMNEFLRESTSMV